MLSAQRPGARRRKRRRPARRERKGGRTTGPGGRGARRAGDAPQRRRGPGMAAGRAQRAGRRPPGRVGGGGGAGAGAFAASPPRSAAASVLRLRSPALSTHFPSFLFLPRTPVWPRCRLGRANLQARSEDTGGSADRGGCGIQYGGRGRAAHSESAAPASAPPGDRAARGPRSRRTIETRGAGQSSPNRRGGRGTAAPAPGASAAARTGGTDRGGSRGGALL